jgi:hypothetical protein
MSQADSINTTRPSADTSRRRFLLFVSAASAAGAGSLAVAAMPIPVPAPTLQCTFPASAGKASPALREAMIELNAAHKELEAAKARFLADDMKMTEWDKANPEPQGKRAKRRHVRKWNEVREATVRESWDAQLAAEDRFQYGIGVMQPMFGRCETMQHKAMHDIFRKGQRNDTTGEKHSVRTNSELRNC